MTRSRKVDLLFLGILVIEVFLAVLYLVAGAAAACW